MRTIVWTQSARDEYRDALVYLAEESADAAVKVAARVEELVGDLAYNAIGRPGRAAGTYERAIPGLFYITYTITYPAEGIEQIAILRVVHGTRE